jgi:uncharacterized protein YodC (DUF2158 family)
LNLPKVPIMSNLSKPAVIALQAAMGVVLSAPCAVTALAEDAPAKTATSQATPTLRGGDLVRLRSGGPVMTVKGVHGNWVICTWWHEAFGQFRTVGFPANMIDGPITLPSPAASLRTDASLQTTGQTGPAVQSSLLPDNLTDAGQANQNPTAQGTNQNPTAQGTNPNPTAQGTNPNPTAQSIDQSPPAQGSNQATGGAPTRPANARTSLNSPTTPTQASPSQPGSGQINQNSSAQAINEPLVARVTPGQVFPQGTVELVVPLQQGSINAGRARPAFVLSQGGVQTAVPLQQSAATSQAVAATNQTVGAINQTVGATNPTVGAGMTRAASTRTSMSPQGAIGRRF